VGDKTLTVTESRVQEAARSCPDARVILQTLFPESFKPKNDRVEFVADDRFIRSVDGTIMAQIRPCGNELYYHRSIWLSSSYNWSFEIDNTGARVLVARPKK